MLSLRSLSDLLLSLILTDLQLELESLSLSEDSVHELFEGSLGSAKSPQEVSAVSGTQELSMVRNEVLDIKSSIF